MIRLNLPSKLRTKVQQSCAAALLLELDVAFDINFRTYFYITKKKIVYMFSFKLN